MTNGATGPGPTPIQPTTDEPPEGSVAFDSLFNVDGTVSDDVPIGAIIMHVSQERADVLDQRIRDMAAGINDQTELIRDANNVMAEMKSLKKDAGKGGSEMSPEALSFLEQNGIEFDRKGNDNIHNKDEWDVNIQYVQTFVDSKTSQTQQMMTNLKSYADKHNQAHTLTVNFIDGQKQNMDGILQKV